MPDQDHEEPEMRSDRTPPRPTHDERISHRRRKPAPRTRVWPLYLLVLLLLAALSALGFQYYQDRQAFESRLDELSRSTENVAQGREELSSNIDAALVSLRQGQMEQQQMIEAQREQSRAQKALLEARPDIDPASIDRRLTALSEADSTLEQSQAAQQQSLETLDGMILGLREHWDSRITRLDERLNAVESGAEALESRQQTLSSRLEELNETGTQRGERIDALAARLDEIDALSAKISENASRLERLQQNQTQLRAAQESLRDVFAR